MGAITIKFAAGETLIDEKSVQDSFFIVKEVRTINNTLKNDGGLVVRRERLSSCLKGR